MRVVITIGSVTITTTNRANKVAFLHQPKTTATKDNGNTIWSSGGKGGCYCNTTTNNNKNRTSMKKQEQMNKIMRCNKKGNAKSGLEWEHG